MIRAAIRRGWRLGADQPDADPPTADAEDNPAPLAALQAALADRDRTIQACEQIIQAHQGRIRELERETSSLQQRNGQLNQRLDEARVAGRTGPAAAATTPLRQADIIAQLQAAAAGRAIVHQGAWG